MDEKLGHLPFAVLSETKLSTDFKVSFRGFSVHMKVHFYQQNFRWKYSLAAFTIQYMYL